MAGNRRFGHRIRELREKKKQADPRFSLRKFAEAVGISATFLSKIETGEFAPPAPDKIKRMAELLGVDADELLALANKVDPDLSEIIKEQPKAMADFLRTVREKNLSEEDLRRLTEQLRKRKD
ncbi:MAG: helix-turn-helix domain-containing protein [Phycisphaerales bacterium]|jgi:transcriptional regulator with XRE-family HTH domain|nr:helix-turn-helix domain-containing protein [Phycisphaerales bacterium]